VWQLSDGTAGQTAGWASGLQPDGQHEFRYLMDPEPLGDVASAPPPDPKLYATYDGSMGEPKDPALGTVAAVVTTVALNAALAAELLFGVRAAGRQLEDVARPLTVGDAEAEETGPGDRSGQQDRSAPDAAQSPGESAAYRRAALP
jgi:hypothetical protein